MPFSSEAQRRFMFAKHPKIAEEFAKATPKGADLPEHVKHMAEGGAADAKLEETKKPEDTNLDLESSSEAFTKGMRQTGVTHDSDAVRSYLSSAFHHLLHPGEDTPKTAPTGYNEGGKVERSELEHQTPNAMMARAMNEGGYAEGGYPHVTFLENETPEKVQKVVHLEPKKHIPVTSTETGEKMAEGGAVHKAEDRNKEPAKPADINKSHEEKLAAIYKAMGMQKYAVGGTPAPLPQAGPSLNTPSPSDPSYWDQIKAALAQVTAPITKPLGAAANLAANVGSAAAPVVPAAISAVNSLTGANIPVPPVSAPITPTVSVTEPSQTMQPPVAPHTPPPEAPAAQPSGVGSSAQGTLKNLFNQDTSKLTEGVNAEDRQALASKMQGEQRGLGSLVAEALSGLGDALAAKGGREQHSLKDIFSMQKQDREEALANFDKARQDRLEKLDLQTKMGNNSINKLAAQDAYGVDEHLNKMLGAPPGTAHKDLPLYMQMMSAQVAQQEKDTDLYMKAHAQAASEVDAALKNAGMFNIKPSPAQIEASGAKLADQYYNRAKGNILFQPSDGQKAVWLPAKNIQKAKQMDPNGQIIP